MSVLELEFDGYATPEPPPDFNYIVDDFGMRYGPGPWPFYRYTSDLVRSETTGEFRANGNYQWQPSSVRLAPDAEYTAARTQYVLVYPADERFGLRLLVDFEVYHRPQGLGGWVGHCSAALDPKTFRARELLCPKEVRELAVKKLRKIVAFLRASIAERDAGRNAPETAHERWVASQTE